MFRYILRLWIWSIQDRIAQFRYRKTGHTRLGPLLDVCVGERRLRGLPLPPDVACHDHQVILADDVFVRRVEWWKKGDWLYPEFLVLHVQERRRRFKGKTPGKSVFLIERNPMNIAEGDLEEHIGEPLLLNFYEDANGTVLTNPPPPEPQPQPQLQPWRSLTSVVDTLTHPMGVFIRTGRTSNYEGGDVMIFSADGTDSFVHSKPNERFLCRTLTIHGDYLTVPEVATLTRVVHNYHRSDKFKAYQSSWFADTIYTTIQTIIQNSARIPPVATSVEQPRSKLFKDETRCTKLKIGQFQLGTKKYYVKQGDPDAPSKVYAEYLVAWDVMKKEIARIRIHMTAEQRARIRQIEEDTKASEERKKAIEEKTKAMEERTKATEEKNSKLEVELEILKRQYAPGPSSSSQDTPVTLSAS